MKKKLLVTLDDILGRGEWGAEHYSLEGEAPVDAWAPDYPHVEVVRSGRLPIAYESASGAETVTLRRHDVFYGVPNSWNRRGYDTSRSLFCIHFMPEYMRFTLGSRSSKDSLTVEPQLWHHTADPLDPAGGVVASALHMAIRGRRDRRAISHLLRALLTLARSQLADDTGPRSGRRRGTWLRLRDHVAERFHLPINRNTVADDFGLAPDYVSRLFADEGGEPFNTYLNRLRMERAAALLEASDVPVAEAALRSGFTDAGYFIKVFQRHFGATPGRWRRRHSPLIKHEKA